MFTYCDNNPVMYSDPSGEYYFASANTVVVERGDTMYYIARSICGDGDAWQKIGGYYGSVFAMPVGTHLDISQLLDYSPTGLPLEHPFYPKSGIPDFMGVTREAAKNPINQNSYLVQENIRKKQEQDKRNKMRIDVALTTLATSIEIGVGIATGGGSILAAKSIKAILIGGATSGILETIRWVIDDTVEE